jgi:plastocyanin
MKFDQFIAQLTRLGFVGPWHFAPKDVNAAPGQTFVVFNHGGEAHTFTEVENFGGGIVPMLNNLAHVPKVAPECLALDPDDFVKAGATYEEEVEEDAEGVEHYLCCIHPWMRVDAHIHASH